MSLHKTNLKTLAPYLFVGSSSYAIYFLLSNSVLSGYNSRNPLVLWSQIQEYLVFLLIVGLITLTWKFFQRQSNIRVNDIECLSEKKDSRFWESRMKALIIYSLLYCFLTSIQHLFVTDFSSSNMIMLFNQDLANLNQENFMLPSRRLEEETLTSSEKTPMQLASISLPIGRVLSSLGIPASHVILSKDTKTAFISLDRSGGLKVVDVSDLENPITISSMKLISIDPPFLGKNLLLSDDQKTLFASNMHRLEIIDVSNPETPVILGQFEDGNLTNMLQDPRFPYYTLDYRVSMAFSKDLKTLFIGGLGLQVIDISDLKKPIVISSNTEKLTNDNLLQTQIQVNGEKLYVANGSSSLNIYNVTNARNFIFLASYSVQHYSLNSVVLSKKCPEEVAYILGRAADRTVQGMIFEKINISDPAKPTSLGSYPFSYHTRARPYILGLGLDENIAFIRVWDGLVSQDVGIFDLSKKEFKIGGNASLIKKATSLVVFPGDESKIIIAQNSMKLSMIQFDTDFPNKRIFSFPKNPLGHLVTPTSLTIDSLILTSDGKTLIAQRGSEGFPRGALEIINISDYSNPVLLGSYDTTERIKETRYLEDAKKVVIIYEEKKMSLLDLSDLTKPTLLANFSTEIFCLVSTIHFSSDGKKAYMVSSGTQKNYTLSILDLSDFSNGKILSQTQIHPTYKSVLTKDSKVMILLGAKLSAFDVSNPEKPFVISSIPGELNTIPFVDLSSDEKFLYAKVYAGSAYSLRIYNLTDLSGIKLQGDLLLPEAKTFQARNLAFSSDGQKAYIGADEGHILGINISNPSSPFVQGTWNLADTFTQKSYIQLVKLSQDGKKMIFTSGSELGTIDLTTPYSLYLHTEHIRLGQKYSESVPILKLNEKEEYELFDKSHRFLKASLFSVKANPAKPAPEASYIPFPYWMSFDKENQILTVEPKKQENLGTYTVYSAFSTRLPEDAFEKLYQSQDARSLNDQDLIITLISLGYLDNQMYLTSRFEAYEDFRIPKEYNSLKKDIFSILKQYYFETFTMFDIFPSLDVAYEKRISINTLSYNPIRVDIVLSNKQNGFVNKQYGSIKPLITEGKSRIILEGSKKEINNALELLVVNLENNNTLCGGTIVISDRLNPGVTKAFTDISKFFNINQLPQVQIPLQGQIDSHNVYTGTYFTINFKNGTFIDSWDNELIFELANGNPGKSLPAWISFGNMSLRGTPPEELFEREMEFVLIVNNEFKETRIPFVLNVKISPTFAFKLLLKNSPYILTIIGLIVYANKIYNIVAKKRYRHVKDFYINVGEEMSASVVIPPIIFIWQEKQESDIILKYLKESVAQELDKSSISDLELAEYFISEDGGLKINRGKMEKRVRKIFTNIPQGIANSKLRLYCKGAESSYQLINQIVFNQLTSYLLENNQEVKKAFDQIKDDWADLVSWNTDGSCKINEAKLNDRLKNPSGGSNGDYRVMGDNEPIKNIDLLKDAISGYAFSKQSIDYRAIQAHIVIREKIESNALKGFLKLDLENVNFSDKGKMGYGMYYKIENDVLSFYGVPEEKFLDKTVVVQITNLKHRILSEIWIHGALKSRRLNRMSEMNDEVGRGKDYEVY